MDSALNIQSGSYQVKSTATGTTFTPWKPLKSAESEVKTRSDSVSLTLQPSQETQIKSLNSFPVEVDENRVTKYSSLTAEQQKSYKEAVMTLNKNARLFVEDNGKLRRAAPVEVKESLDNGGKIYLITSLANESNTHSSYSSAEREKLGFINYCDYNFSSSSSSSKYQYVHYTASPFSRWEDLDFADFDGKGIPGVSSLPEPGGKALVSSEWESDWQTRTYDRSGLFRVTEENTNSGGHTSISRR